MSEPTRYKDPDAEIDYGWDWSPWLVDGDAIASSVWTISPSADDDDLAAISAKNGLTGSHDASGTAVWVEKGIVGVTYRLTNEIVTDDGRKDQRTILVKVTER